MRVHVHGARGRMGSAACEAIDADPDLELCGRSGRGDDLKNCLQQTQPEVVVEFTVPQAVETNLRLILGHGAHVVSGTTGLPPSAANGLGELAESLGLGCLLAPNFCLGVILMQRFARSAARWFDDVEIVEMHHQNKLDAPSGTSLHTAQLIREAAGRPLNQGHPREHESLAGARGASCGDIPIHSIRLPGLLAHQEILFAAAGQVLSIRHDCLDRQAFMPGILLAIRRIGGLHGLIDSLDQLLDNPQP